VTVLGHFEGDADTAKAVARSPLIARRLGRRIARETVERRGHAVKHRLRGKIAARPGEIGRARPRRRDQLGDRVAPATRVGFRRHRHCGELAAGIGQDQRRPEPAGISLGDRQLVVEPRQSRRARHSELPARHRLDIKIGNLVEAARKQLPARIGSGRLVVGASCEGQRQRDSRNPREHKRGAVHRAEKFGATRQA
jgi:hypothetical protein